MVGVGRWKDKQDWPEEVKVLEVVAEMKIFGFHIPANLGQSCEKFRESFTSCNLDSWRPPGPEGGGGQDLRPQQAQ